MAATVGRFNRRVDLTPGSAVQGDHPATVHEGRVTAVVERRNDESLDCSIRRGCTPFVEEVRQARHRAIGHVRLFSLDDACGG